MTQNLIIGGNRGIGLQLCKQLTSKGESVIATCRSSNDELEKTGATVIDNIDVCRAADVNTLKSKLEEKQIDMLIHNSGILSNESLEEMDFERIEKQFIVNTLGPLRVIHALQNNLSSGSKIGILSSRMGSMGDNGSGGRYGYRISKAGVNALGVSLARDLEDQQIAVALLHPGLVATEMTGGAGINPADAASGILTRMDELTLETTGRFWHAEGYELPW